MNTTADLPACGVREDALFAREMWELDRYHRQRCAPYARIANAFVNGERIIDLPFVHVGLFKSVDLRSTGVLHGRTLLSSATTSGTPSRIAMDEASSARQARSVTKILGAWLGERQRPVLVLDSPSSLRARSGVSARVAAGLSLRSLASDLRFVLKEGTSFEVDWNAVRAALDGVEDAIVYGFTYMLWKAWATAAIPSDVQELLQRVSIAFVHSGGWKKLEDERVDRDQLESELLQRGGPHSEVLDYYGLVEQVGVIFPLCKAGARHVPPWADVIVRDTYTQESLDEGIGQLQLLNVLPLGGPYHSVLTEDLGRMLTGECSCGRAGRRFELIGRVPKAETRGCANV